MYFKYILPVSLFPDGYIFSNRCIFLERKILHKAAAICSNNRNNIVAEYEVYIVAEYGICLLKKVTPPFKAQLLSMLEGNTMSLKDNAALRSKKTAVLWKVPVAPFLRKVLSFVHPIHLKYMLHLPKRKLSQLSFTFESSTNSPKSM